MNPPEGADNPADPEAAAEPAGPADPDPAVTPDTGDGKRPRSRRQRLLTRVAVFAAVRPPVALVVTASVVKVPYYKFSPGSLYPTESLVSVNGTDSYVSDGGQIDFTTVSSKKASVFEYLLAGGTVGEDEVARFDEAVQFVDAEKFERGRTPEENRQENLESMASSKQLAEVAALAQARLSRRGPRHGRAGEAGSTRICRGGTFPAVGASDERHIVEVDGQPIELGEDAVAAIGAHGPGDTSP